MSIICCGKVSNRETKLTRHLFILLILFIYLFIFHIGYVYIYIYIYNFFILFIIIYFTISYHFFSLIICFHQLVNPSVGNYFTRNHIWWLDNIPYHQVYDSAMTIILRVSVLVSQLCSSFRLKNYYIALSERMRFQLHLCFPVVFSFPLLRLLRFNQTVCSAVFN